LAQGFANGRAGKLVSKTRNRLRIGLPVSRYHFIGQLIGQVSVGQTYKGCLWAFSKRHFTLPSCERRLPFSLGLGGLPD